MRDSSGGQGAASRSSSRSVKGDLANPTVRGRASIESLERRVLMAAQLCEAEAAVIAGAGLSRSPGGFTGSGFVDYMQPSGESVEWTINVNSAGIYALDLRYANGRGDRPLELKIDGVVTDPAMSFPTTGDWTTWLTRSRNTSLAAGTHTVRLTSIGSAGPNLDSLTVRAVEGTPAPEPGGTQALQAEAAAFAGGRKSAARSGYTGTGYVDFDHASGDYVEWSATVASAKTYGLSFRYANGAALDRPLQLTVNGQVVAASLSFAPTGAWTKWATSTAVVALGAGTNTVRVSATGFGGPNLDALVIPSAPAPDPGPDPDPGQDIRNLRVYHIGNSLTNGINYAALDEMAGKDGREYIFGRNVISGAPLSWIWDHPEQGNRQSPFGRFRESFAQDTWDVLTLQPFDRQLYQDSGAGDVQMAQNFINLAMKKSPDLQTYIYQHWPRRVKNADGSYGYDYERLWLREYTGKWDKSYESRDYNNRLVEELRGAYPAARKPVLMVPVGDVMFELNRRIEAERVPGIDDIAELFWDGIHMTNWGAFLTGTTFYATMYKRDPRGLDSHTYEVLDDPWDRKIPAGFATAVQDVVWDVVKGHPYSGV